MLSVFEPTVPSIERELRETAEVMGMTDGITSMEAEYVPDALAVLRSGDEALYNEMVADAAEAMHARTDGGLDVVVLAMFSMACAGPTVQARLGDDIPTLTSPQSAVEKMKRLLQA